MNSNTTTETTTTESVDHLNTPEVNRAAYNFQNSMKLIKIRTRSLSKKSMERVFDAVLEFPLSKEEPKFRNQFEHELFILSLNALASKNQMMEAVINDQTQSLNKLKEAEEAMKKEEVTNGTSEITPS